MSDEQPTYLRQRRMDRYRAQLDAWLEVHGGFRCTGCGGQDWAFYGYQLVEFSWFKGPNDDDLQAGGYIAGHIGCTTCRRVVLYDLTAIESGATLELRPDAQEAAPDDEVAGGV